LESRRANRLENNNKQFAPETRMTPRELPGTRKTVGQPENEFIHFLVCPAVFRCALCAQRASEAGCPEAVDGNFVSRCDCSFYGHKRSPFRFLFGRTKRNAPVVSLPRQISFLLGIGIKIKSAGPLYGQPGAGDQTVFL